MYPSIDYGNGRMARKIIEESKESCKEFKSRVGTIDDSTVLTVDLC